jgi:membrane associated rhomboid family serine protease
MRDAAVGFQCPDCVKIGSKQTRSGRTAYGGQRSANPALTSFVLIGLNALVWLAVVTTGGDDSVWLRRLVLWREDVTLLYPGGREIAVTGVADGAVWELLTSAFTHVQPWHIGFNMLALYVLGPQLELAIGRVRFLAVYLGSALAGSALVYWFSAVNTYTLGASGAIFGLMAAMLVVAYKVRGDVRTILIWIGVNFMITVVGRSFISWEGHLGGFLGGLALMGVIAYAPRERRTTWQVAGIGAIALAVLVALVVRTLMLL